MTNNNLRLIISLDDIETIKDLSDRILDIVSDDGKILDIVERAAPATEADFDEDNAAVREYFETLAKVVELTFKEALASLRIGGDSEAVTKH